MLSLALRVACILVIAHVAVAAAQASEGAVFVQIDSIAELDHVLQSSEGTPILLRVSADWDFSNSEMDKHFASTSMKELLVDVVLLEIDITNNTDQHREFLSTYQVFGAPHIIFFDRNGEHIADKDIAGYQTEKGLAEQIRDVLRN